MMRWKRVVSLLLAACMLLWSAGENLALLTGCALTVVLRLCAAVFRWSLPKA